MEILDRREDPPGTGLCATALGPALQRALDDNGRAVCVLNRRGRARLLACAACREVVRCAGCGAAMTQAGVELRCPRCGAERDAACRHCGSVTLRVLRPGVLRARQEVEGLVGRHRVIAVDAGSAPLPVYDVAVGTEAVFHRVESDPHRPIRLVAFLEFDQELLAPRYRATEQARWLLVRAARLLGGRSEGGVLLVQTRVPDDVVFAGPDGIERAVAFELDQRRALGYPPFGGLAELSGADDAVDGACRLLRDLDILGPSRGRALLRAPSIEMLCDRLSEVDLSSARDLGRLRVEVDPLRV
jgi:primosomal protein N' (replication factor Y)